MNKRSILIVEDNPDDQLLLRHSLQTADIPNPFKFVSTSQDARTYLEQCEKTPHGMPGLILLDLMLHNENGLTYLKELRQNPATHCIPVVILSESRKGEHLTESYELGANSFVSKAGSLAEFNAKIHCICDYWLGVCQLPEV